MSDATGTLVRLGFSPCPNDTFMFHGLVSGQIELPGILLYPVIEDIEALNQRAVGAVAQLAMSKLSVTALGRVSDRYAALRSGAALGRGCGPLVVRRPGGPVDLAQLSGKSVAIPGAFTTAHMLLRIFAPPDLEVVPMRFEQVMPAVARGEVEAGVVIHEGRFTFGAHDLEQVVDLGERWESVTGLPIPLGLICVGRSLPPAVADALEAGLRDSIALAFREPHRSRTFVRQHAQEMDPEVCRQHIALYVNEFSLELGPDGIAAVDELFVRGREAGMIEASASPWR